MLCNFIHPSPSYYGHPPDSVTYLDKWLWRSSQVTSTLGVRGETGTSPPLRILFGRILRSTRPPPHPDLKVPPRSYSLCLTPSSPVRTGPPPRPFSPFPLSPGLVSGRPRRRKVVVFILWSFLCPSSFRWSILRCLRTSFSSKVFFYHGLRLFTNLSLFFLPCTGTVGSTGP